MRGDKEAVARGEKVIQGMGDYDLGDTKNITGYDWWRLMPSDTDSEEGGGERGREGIEGGGGGGGNGGGGGGGFRGGGGFKNKGGGG